jgi:hypothetical protein
LLFPQKTQLVVFVARWGCFAHHEFLIYVCVSKTRAELRERWNNTSMLDIILQTSNQK